MQLTLYTERLVLIPIGDSDLDLALELYTDKQVMKYIGWVETTEEVRINFERYTQRAGNGCIGLWVVSDSTTSEKYGTICLLPLPIDKPDTDWDLVDPAIPVDYEVEIGYIFKSSAWGKGIATEAAKRLVQFAFEHSVLDEITAVIDHDHERSRNVLLKCGFEPVGEIKAYNTLCAGFRITRNGWLKK